MGEHELFVSENRMLPQQENGRNCIRKEQEYEINGHVARIGEKISVYRGEDMYMKF
jgi:hypothetical protein